jgi:hypothetical protein
VFARATMVAAGVETSSTRDLPHSVVVENGLEKPLTKASSVISIEVLHTYRSPKVTCESYISPYLCITRPPIEASHYPIQERIARRIFLDIQIFCEVAFPWSPHRLWFCQQLQELTRESPKERGADCSAMPACVVTGGNFVFRVRVPVFTVRHTSDNRWI